MEDGPPPAGSAVRVVLDAMGGDQAPQALVAGALKAHQDGVEVVLVGRRAELERELADAGSPGALDIVEASEVIGMDEDPALALRAKPEASIRVAAAMVAGDDGAALLSAGSTGATLAAALLAVGRIPGIRRPAVAAVLPFGDGVVLVDAGGSPDVQPEALSTYAAMGVSYARARGVARPRVGLLNVGAEPGKGNALAQAAFGLLESLPGFAGNVEPSAVLSGAVDVVVTDGFTGNVFLKTVEAASGLGGGGSGRGPGAAVIVGVAANVLVAHGAAGSDEIAAALRTAHDVAAAGLASRIAEGLEEHERLK